MLKIKRLLVAVPIALVAGCSSGDKMPASEEKKMADGFQHPPKLSDLPADEQKRVQAMMDAHRTPPGQGGK